MLTRGGSEAVGGGGHFDADQIAGRAVGYSGGGGVDEAFAEADVPVAVDHTEVAHSAVKAPDGDHRPKVAVVYGAVKAGVAGRS